MLEGLLMRAVKGSLVGKGSSIHVKYSEWILFCAWPPAMWGNICLIRRLACREAELDSLNFLCSSILPSPLSQPLSSQFLFSSPLLEGSRFFDTQGRWYRGEGGINLITFCMTLYVSLRLPHYGFLVEELKQVEEFCVSIWILRVKLMFHEELIFNWITHCVCYMYWLYVIRIALIIRDVWVEFKLIYW